MKTAISIEAPLLQETDRTARKLGVSRSRFVSMALKSYLRESRNRETVEQLNRVWRGSRYSRSIAPATEDEIPIHY